MPAAIAGIVAWEFFGATITGYWLAYTAVYAATAFALTRATASLGPDLPDGAGRGLEITIQDTGAEGAAIYGKIRCGGVQVIPWLSGFSVPPTDDGNNTGRFLDQVHALAVHEVDSFVDCFCDNEQITDAQITAVSGNADDGKVTATKYANAMWIRRYRGTASQSVDYILSQRYSSLITSDFRGRGIAYAAVSFDWGDGKTYTGWPALTYEVKGKRCYDPRLDSSPGADPTNASYAAWTENPALCWGDFATADYGGRCPTSSIDWQSVADAADVCDDLVAIPGSTTQKRYTFNARLMLGADWRENAKKIIDAMLGRYVYRDGIHRIYAGAWEAPSDSIEKSDWLSIEEIKTVAPSAGGRWNTVRCWYIDPARNWQREECFPRRNATYKSADGALELALEMEQSGCTNEYEAQRKSEFILRQSRNQIGMSGRLPMRFRHLTTGQTVALNFEELGWVSKLMRIRSMNLNPDGTVDVGIVEEQEGDWTDLAAGEYNAPSSSIIPSTNPPYPSEAVLSITNNVNGTIRFSIADPVVRPIGTRFQLIRSLVANDATAGTVVYDGLTQIIDLPSLNQGGYYFSRAYANSYFGPYSPNTSGLLGQAFTTAVTQVNCTVTQTFSKGAGAFLGQTIGRVDFAPSSAHAIVSVSASFRAGVGNIFSTNGVLLQFVTGVTSSYVTPTVPNGGDTLDPRPTQITGVFTYTAGNSAYVALQWDTSSGPNSVVIDNVSMRTEFIRL